MSCISIPRTKICQVTYGLQVTSVIVIFKSCTVTDTVTLLLTVSYCDCGVTSDVIGKTCLACVEGVDVGSCKQYKYRRNECKSSLWRCDCKASHRLLGKILICKYQNQQFSAVGI